MNLIEIKDMNYLNVFHDFNLNIKKNQLTSLAGPNNCGKTTLIRILSRQINTDAKITVMGRNINEYKKNDYYKIVKCIIPMEEMFIHDTVEDEINYYIDQLFLSKEEKNKRISNIYKNLGINKIKKKNIDELKQAQFVLIQIALSIASMPKIILIDDLSTILNHTEMLKIVSYFKYLIKEYDITIILNSIRLEDIIECDYLYILSDSNVVIEGRPIEVLEKDNLLNKSGIRLPFMVDLSVKLRDYDLIDDVELDMDRMIDTLWN